MTETPESAPAGWYPDPHGSPRQRYFDGTSWTDHFEPDPAAAGAVAGQGGGVEPALSPIGYWKKAVFENYINFKGRARRAEYWWTFLINLVITIVITVIGSIISPEMGTIFQVIASLALLLPGLAVGIRRLHDTGKSGWWLLISFIPILGTIILIVFLATDSERGRNKYGTSPKYG